MLEKDSEYVRDESRQQGTAENMIFVHNREELIRVLEETAGDVGVTVQGGRTGISGAAVPDGGVVVNVSACAGVLEQGECDSGRYMDVLPGTVLSDIQREAEGGWFFPAEPTEESATIGGMYATDAAGPAAACYGTCGRYVLAADVFFPEFGVLHIPRGKYVFDENGALRIGGKELVAPPCMGKKVLRQLTPFPGMDLLDLLAGSEGMLGVFLKFRLKLLKRPQENWKFFFFFREEEDALSFADQISQDSAQWEKTVLAAADFFNRNSLRIFQKYAGDAAAYGRIPEIPRDTCGLMMEICGEDEEGISQALEAILTAFEEYGEPDEHTWAGDAPDEVLKIRRLRHAIPECVNRALSDARVPGSMKLSVDAQADAVPVKECLKTIYGLAGSGCAVTVHLLRRIYHIDPMYEDEREYANAMHSREKLWEYMAENQAILSAENGIGKGKMPQLLSVVSDEQRKTMETVKRFFDRDGRLNPGNAVFGKKRSDKR